MGVHGPLGSAATQSEVWRRRGNTGMEGRAGGEETLNKHLKLKNWQLTNPPNKSLQLTLSLPEPKKVCHVLTVSHFPGTEGVTRARERQKGAAGWMT